jgi:hypothetical protein
MTRKKKHVVEDIADDPNELLNAVGIALDRGYLDELFENREARDSFKADVFGIQIRRIVDAEIPEGVILRDGSVYRDGELHPPAQVIPLPERT